MEHATGGAEPQWRKSSYSDFNGNCLEVAVTAPDRTRHADPLSAVAPPADAAGVRLRDTAHRGLAVVEVGTREWSSLLRLLLVRTRG